MRSWRRRQRARQRAPGRAAAAAGAGGATRTTMACRLSSGTRTAAGGATTTTTGMNLTTRRAPRLAGAAATTLRGPTRRQRLRAGVRTAPAELARRRGGEQGARGTQRPDNVAQGMETGSEEGFLGSKYSVPMLGGRLCCCSGGLRRGGVSQGAVGSWEGRARRRCVGDAQAGPRGDQPTTEGSQNASFAKRLVSCKDRRLAFLASGLLPDVSASAPHDTANARPTRQWLIVS